MLRDLFDQAFGQGMIHFASRAQYLQRHAMRLGQIAQGIHVGLGENSAHAGSRLQAARRNLLVQAQGEGEIDRIGIYSFAQAWPLR